APPVRPPAAPVPAVAAPIPFPPPSVQPNEPLVVPLAQLMGVWPDAVKQALAESSNGTLSLPADELEPALKRGKILFPWKRIRSLINTPLSPSAGQGQEETQLELPLSVIAPLFMAHKRPVAAQRKYALGEQIPDLFTSKGMASSAQ